MRNRKGPFYFSALDNLPRQQSSVDVFSSTLPSLAHYPGKMRKYNSLGVMRDQSKTLHLLTHLTLPSGNGW